MIKYLKLPLTFNADKMAAEVLDLEATTWKAHYNTAHYSGDWSIIPLHAPGGDIHNLISTPAGTTGAIPFADTVFLKRCPYISTVLNQLQCEKRSVRLMYLAPGAIIKPHSDQQLSVEDREVRLHLPVMTNDEMYFYLEEERVKMDAGTCWFLNLSLTHRLENKGQTGRIHLVVDCVVNEWLLAEFNTPGIIKKEIDAPQPSFKHSKEEILLIIEELKRQDNEAARNLIMQMEAKLKDHA